MNYEEFAAWIRALVDEGRLAAYDGDDVLEQRRLFDSQRPVIEVEFDGAVVGMVAGERIVRRQTSALLDAAAEAHTGRLVYFEPIGQGSWVAR